MLAVQKATRHMAKALSASADSSQIISLHSDFRAWDGGDLGCCDSLAGLRAVSGKCKYPGQKRLKHVERVRRVGRRMH